MSPKLKDIVFLVPALLFIGFVPLQGAEPDNNVQQISVISGEDIIAAEINRIPGTEPDTALIIAGGSGVCERADTAAAVPLFLTPTSAVVILDRRGCGSSSGVFTQPATDNSRWLVPRLAMDIEAVAEYLRASGFSRIGVLGSSFGGWLAVSAAATGKLDFIVTINGGGSSVAVSDTFDRLTDEGMSIEEAISATRNTELHGSYDPALDLENIMIPGMFILAAEDDSNPMALDRESIEYWADQGKAFDLIVVENANHDLVNLTTGNVDLSWVQDVLEFVNETSVPPED